METEVADIAKEAIYVLLKVSLPILLIALVVGLLISLLQALTQIQEATLSFVPKIITMMLALIYLMPFMLSHLTHLTERVFVRIVGG